MKFPTKKKKNELFKINVAQISPFTTTMTNFQTPLVSREEVLKIYTCVAHAENANLKNPGSYKNELNKLLKANTLPTIKFPDDEPSTTSNISPKQDIAGATDTETSEPSRRIQATN